ncbi:hypothetical protein [Aquimarina sp. 2201CG14-23]|uniref:hypothetical protein n=1 Tax=Aquimarina mycalae TaxID=3040073 RepID=UPI002477FCFB|nr:hypothetical protein [Aquimarina sp. 2201CG14-23]MDH7445544.1 hypothetical protein [Aquimarina sp. 2201CG14-23]
MKLLLVTALFCVSLGYATTTPVNEKEKTKKEEKKTKEENASVSKNFHSVKKWKITIEYMNGEVISKTITINKNASTSPMESAFIEAENYMKKLKNVRSYNVSPVSRNSFVLLAGN